MDWAKLSKMFAGALAGATGGGGTMLAVIPDNVRDQLPWWGYLLIGLANAAWGAALVFFAPANPPSPAAVREAIVKDPEIVLAAKQGLAAAEAAKPGPLPGGHSSTMKPVG